MVTLVSLDIATKNTTATIAFKIVGFVDAPGSEVNDAFTDVIVKFNPSSHSMTEWRWYLRRLNKQWLFLAPSSLKSYYPGLNALFGLIWGTARYEDEHAEIYETETQSVALKRKLNYQVLEPGAPVKAKVVQSSL